MRVSETRLSTFYTTHTKSPDPSNRLTTYYSRCLRKVEISIMLDCYVCIFNFSLAWVRTSQRTPSKYVIRSGHQKKAVAMNVCGCTCKVFAIFRRLHQTQPATFRHNLLQISNMKFHQNLLLQWRCFLPTFGLTDMTELRRLCGRAYKRMWNCGLRWLCQFWGSHSGASEDPIVLGCEAVYSGYYLPTFRTSVFSSFSTIKKNSWNLEGEDTTAFRFVCVPYQVAQRRFPQYANPLSWLQSRQGSNRDCCWKETELLVPWTCYYCIS